MQSKPEDTSANLWDILTYDSSLNLTYYGYCMNENLRIEAPVPLSLAVLTEDTYLGKYLIKANDEIDIDMYFLHHNKEEWPESEKFIPERFDSTSKWYLNSKGQKRHPMSFGPFIGGKRICIGKTYFETISKLIGPTVLSHFDFEFLDQELMMKKPPNHFFLDKTPKIVVGLKKYSLL